MGGEPVYDLLIVGGGINGVGIARDAAGRGLSVLLCEQGDLAGHTSSSSTKLVHGGLRYLEYYEFNLVRKALQEREVLLRAAPHIIWPLRFVMPYHQGLRPAWLIRAGLFLYDHLGKRDLLPGSASVDLRHHPAGKPLRADLRKGFVYSDAWVDDARLVILNAIDAAERGASVLPRTRCTSARRGAGHWDATLEPASGGAVQSVKARALVNAAGPWAVSLLRESLAVTPRRNLRMAKGSHIVVPKLFDHDYAYILQNPDKRIIFAIPYEGDFTLIGTTDVEYDGDPARPTISADETAYLCEMANRYFLRKISSADVVWSYSGVRPLLEDESADLSAVTRDYVLEYDAGAERAPLLSVFGGKITTYRRLAEEAMDLLAPGLGGVRPAWTAAAALPGGDIANADFDGFLTKLQRRLPWLPAELARRYARAYGTRVERLLGNARSLGDLGEAFGAGLYEAEIEYLVRNEWAASAEDVLWRRTKLGLHVAPETAQRVATRLPALAGARSNHEIHHAADA
jgi:glycerol-3-phosphate dehydrogenase